MKTNHQRNISRINPTLSCPHPPGGFVAWPENNADLEDQKVKYELRRRRRERRGFVAWPETLKTK